LTLDPFGPVNNHAQTLYGLKYSTTAWRIGSEDPFHTKHFKAGLKGVTWTSLETEKPYRSVDYSSFHFQVPSTDL